MTLVWDWNGTLLEDVDAAVYALNAMLRKRGIDEVTRDYYRAHFRFPSRDFYDELGVDLPNEDWNQICIDFHDGFAAAGTQRLRDGAFEALEAARRAGWRQLLLSAHREDLLKGDAAKVGIAGYRTNIFYMKKVIVFRVEEVLVKGNDENRLEEIRGRVFVKKSVGEKVFEEEFYKEDGKKRKVVMSCGEMVVKMVEMEKRFEEEGDLMKKYWIRDVRKKLEDWEEGKEKRLVERRKKFMDEGFEKKMIGKRGELKDLERICEVTGSRMVFVSEEKRSRVGNLLYNNGLRRFEVERGLGFLEGMDEKDYVVIDSVEDLEIMWKKVGLKRN